MPSKQTSSPEAETFSPRLSGSVRILVGRLGSNLEPTDKESIESLGIRRHSIKSPPLISKDAPVMYPAASEATKQIRSATSSAVPSLAIG